MIFLVDTDSNQGDLMRIFFCVFILLITACGKTNKSIKLEPFDPTAGTPTQITPSLVPNISFVGMENTEIYFDSNNIYKNNFKVIPSNHILRRKILSDLTKIGLLKKIVWDQKELVDYLNLNVIEYNDISDKMQLEKLVTGLGSLEEMQFSFDSKLIFKGFDKSDMISDIMLAFYYYYPLTGELRPIQDGQMVSSEEFFSSDNNQYLQVNKQKFNFPDLKQSLEKNSKLVFQVKDYKIENHNVVQKYDELYASYLKNNAMVIISTKEHTEVRFVSPGIKLKDLVETYSSDLTLDPEGKIQCYLGFCQNTETYTMTENVSELDGQKIWYQSAPLNSVLEAAGVYILLSLEGSEFYWHLNPNKTVKKYDLIKADTEVLVINPHDLLKINIKSFKAIPEFTYQKQRFNGETDGEPLPKRLFGSCVGNIRSLIGSGKEELPWKEADLVLVLNDKNFTIQELNDSGMIAILEHSASHIEVQFRNIVIKTLQIVMNKKVKTIPISVGFVGWEGNGRCDLVYFSSTPPQTSNVNFTENQLFDIEIK